MKSHCMPVSDHLAMEDRNYGFPYLRGTETLENAKEKNEGILPYFSLVNGLCLVSDRQYVDFFKMIKRPLDIRTVNALKRPETGCWKRILALDTENKLIGKVYEQLLGFKSYNDHYDEPEKMKDCQCRQ